MFKIIFKRYLGKFKATQSRPQKITLSQTIWAVLGASLSIGIIAYLSSNMDIPLLIAPFGATASLIFSPNLMIGTVAQPRSVIGGYFLCGILGLLFAEYGATEWFYLALSVGLSIGLMHILHVLHPPAAGVPLLILINQMQHHHHHVKWAFLFSPILLGAIILVAVGLLFNNLHRDHQYPKYWIK